MEYNIGLNRDTIPYFLSKRAMDYPNDIAFSFPELNQHYDWSTIWRETRLLAKSFLKLEIKKGDSIALLMPGSMEMLLSMFAAACVGAIIIPLNAYSKKEELENYLKDARPVAIIMGAEGHHMNYPAMMQEIIYENNRIGRDGSWIPTHLFVLNGAEDLAAPFRSFKELFVLGAAINEHHLVAACQANDAADPLILLYTSGTLGTPKGVLRSTASFIASANQAQSTPKGSSFLSKISDRVTRRFSVMSVLPLYHLGGFSIIFTALKACHIRIVMLTHFNPLRALSSVETEKCRVLVGTPFMVLQMLSSSTRKDYNLKCLLGVVFTSAAVNNITLQKIMKDLSLLFFMVSYGSSEAGAVANGTCFLNRKNNFVLPLIYKLLKHTSLFNGIIHYKDFQNDTYSIGGKVDKAVEVKIVSPETGDELPLYSQGEIWIRSYRVMRYTAESSERSSFTADGWYKSGDLGFLDERRHLTITGRLHRLISRGGEKISPIEIENVLLRHEDVAEAVVLGIPDELYGEQICACIVLRQGAEITADKLRNDLAPYLSTFKLPRYFVFLPILPLSATGKISVADLKSYVLNGIGERRKNA